jgi:hypothetical protein
MLDSCSPGAQHFRWRSRREPRRVLAKVDKRLALLRRGRKLMSNDLAQFIQRSRREVHDPLEFSAIPALVSSQTRRTDTPLSYLSPPFESQRRDQLLEIAKDFATQDHVRSVDRDFDEVGHPSVWREQKTLSVWPRVASGRHRIWHSGR